jgi:hypothetical protein
MGGKQTIRFQQYYNNLPIIDVPGFHYGVMKMEMQQGTTTVYERSLIYMKSEDREKVMVKLLGGKLLAAKIAKAAEDGEVSELYPAYRPILENNGLVLSPVWVLELKDGTVRTLQ